MERCSGRTLKAGGISRPEEHRNFGSPRESDHAGRALAAGERHDQIRVAFLEHLLIANRAGSAAMTLPIGLVDLRWDAAITGPLFGQRIGAPSTASNQN